MRTSSIVRETGRRVRATFAGAVLCALGVACHAVPPGEPTPSVDQGAVTTPVDPLPRDWEPFDTRFLHRIEILVAPEHLEALERDRDTRVPCDITLNGITLRQAGIRQKGGGGSIRPLHDKPSFSLRFDEFVEDQSYRGLDRLLLNNSVQDPSLLNEHLAYELHRRAGLPAPRTRW